MAHRRSESKKTTSMMAVGGGLALPGIAEAKPRIPKGPLLGLTSVQRTVVTKENSLVKWSTSMSMSWAIRNQS
jgi:hypothetical protein